MKYDRNLKLVNQLKIIGSGDDFLLEETSVYRTSSRPHILYLPYYESEIKISKLLNLQKQDLTN